MTEIDETRVMLITEAQLEFFREELDDIKSQNSEEPEKFRELKKTKHLFRLNPILGLGEMLRVGG